VVEQKLLLAVTQYIRLLHQVRLLLGDQVMLMYLSLQLEVAVVVLGVLLVVAQEDLNIIVNVL
jgi:hypothetical protein